MGTGQPEAGEGGGRTSGRRVASEGTGWMGEERNGWVGRRLKDNVVTSLVCSRRLARSDPG